MFTNILVQKTPLSIKTPGLFTINIKSTRVTPGWGFDHLGESIRISINILRYQH